MAFADMKHFVRRVNSLVLSTAVQKFVVVRISWGAG